MRIKTKHFGFYLGRDWAQWHWAARVFGIGFVANDQGPAYSPYRYSLYGNSWLIPEIEWEQIYLGNEIDPLTKRSKVMTQLRIHAIKGWQFNWYLGTYRGVSNA